MRAATFILCCARKNVNYSKVRPAITYHLLLQINNGMFKQTKTKTKQKTQPQKLQLSSNKNTLCGNMNSVSLLRTFSAEER